MASCDATTFESTRRPSASTAAAVSSHELSMPSTINSPALHAVSRATQKARAMQPSPRAPGLASPLMRASRLLWPDLGLRVLPRTLLLDDAHGLDDVERPLHLDVLLQIFHRIQGRLPLARRRCRLFGQLHDDVRRDALAVDRPALGGEVLRGREPEPRAVGQRDDRLHRALAGGLGTHDDRAAPVLERA